MKIALPRTQAAKGATAIAVTLIAIAGVVTGREKPALEIVEAKQPKAETVAAERQIDLEKLQRSASAALGVDPFAPRSFAPRPARQAGAPGEGNGAAAQPPAAPALPFTYFGRLTENGKTEVFVMRGDDVISISAGQKIDDEYRVDAVSESSIVFTYLPLKTRQSIELGEANG